MILARFLSKIYKKNGIILIDSQGQKYICGKPDLKKACCLLLECEQPILLGGSSCFSRRCGQV